MLQELPEKLKVIGCKVLHEDCCTWNKENNPEEDIYFKIESSNYWFDDDYIKHEEPCYWVYVERVWEWNKWNTAPIFVYCSTLDSAVDIILNSRRLLREMYDD